MRSLHTDMGSKFARIYADTQHRLTLNSIRSQLDNSPPNTSRFSVTHSRGRKFQQKERTLNIIKENGRFLDRLLESSLKPKRKSKAQKVKGKSLNKSLRKQENSRICQENEALARRLVMKNSTVNTKALLKDFLVKLKYRKNISNDHIFELSPKIPYFPCLSPKASSLRESYLKGIDIHATVLKKKTHKYD